MKDLPRADWKSLPISSFAKTSAGGTPRKSEKKFYDGGTIPWLLSGEVARRDITEAKNFITEEGLKGSSAKLFPTNSVLVAMYGATAGEVGILRFEAATNQAVCAILPSDAHVPEYIYYYLLNAQRELVSQAVGNAQPNISQAKIKAIEVPLPPLEEQRRIVAKLDEAFEGLDRARVNAEVNLSDAEQIAARSLDVILEDLIVRNGRITVDEIAAVKGGKRLPKGSKPSSAPTPHPYISVKDLTEDGTVSTAKLGYISEQVQRSIARYTISRRDVYISIAGTIGKSGIVPDELDGANLTENAAKLVLQPGWSTEYIYWCTRSADFAVQTSEQTRVAAQPKLALQRLEAITIPKASEAEQIALCEKMNALRVTRSELIEAYSEKLQDLSDLRQSLLQKAFAGELT